MAVTKLDRLADVGYIGQIICGNSVQGFDFL